MTRNGEQAFAVLPEPK